MQITCGTCNGDGFVSYGDRHVENRKEVCGECGGHGWVAACTGENPAASASPDGGALYAIDAQQARTLSLDRMLRERDSNYVAMGVREPLADPRVALARALEPTPVAATNRWTYRFEENGGYDCMTSAYSVYENGQLRVTFDVRYMPDFDGTSWYTACRPYDSAERLAKQVTDELNAAGFRTHPNSSKTTA